VEGLSFRAGIFTNLTQDHLDYHGTMEEYFRAKKVLFDMLGADAVAITNADDPRGRDVIAGTHSRTITYGTTPEADIRAVDIDVTIQGVRFSVETRNGKESVTSPLTGRFNVANILAAYATGVGLGLPVEQLMRGIAGLKAVRGRFEKILSPAGWTAVVDYAHTPDALENCLRTIDEILPRVKRGRIITIFGCGGNRDAGKRPIMGRIASQRSDVIIVTSDNPRKENPKAIIEQVMAGVEKGVEVYSEVDRRKAIVMGLDLARPGDIVLVAGKGHETYQVVGDTKSHLDDREEIENYINAHP